MGFVSGETVINTSFATPMKCGVAFYIIVILVLVVGRLMRLIEHILRLEHSTHDLFHLHAKVTYYALKIGLLLACEGHPTAGS